MRNFNPDKELNKIKYRKRNKIVLLCFLMIVVSLISYSFALYQVRHTKRIIYTTVDDFKNNKDIILTVLVDGKEENTFPAKNTGYIYDGIECENNQDGYTIATFSKYRWALEVVTQGPNKCNVKFKKGIEPNPPELYDGLIPVTIEDNGTIKVADINSKWYNYDERIWANAVLVSSNAKTKYTELDYSSYKTGTEVDMNDILQMYVWIPRYKYKLFNAVNKTSSTPQMIEIEFESGTATTGTVECSINKGTETCTNAENGNWYTHPAFNFGDSVNKEENTQLTGIWVGKFENSGTTTEITIKPSIKSLINIPVGTMFNAVRDVENKYSETYGLTPSEIDTHMMKNMEWGAVAYLSSSIYGRYIDKDHCVEGGCETWLNNISTCITGCSATPASSGTKPFIDTAVSSCDTTTYWNGEYGRHASTTDNISGIYDMNGGTYEHVMGNQVSTAGGLYSPNAGITISEARYYDTYVYNTNEAAHERGHLGDATRETLSAFGNINAGTWYGNGTAWFPGAAASWFVRGGGAIQTSVSSLFSFSRVAGNARTDVSFRSVLTRTA